MMSISRPVTSILSVRLLFRRAIAVSSFRCNTGLLRNYSVQNVDKIANKEPTVKGEKAKGQDKLHKIIAKSKLLSRLNKNPKFSTYFNRLSDAGVTSSVTSFLILHEVTAIVPLFGLWWVLYQLDLHDQYELPLYFTNLLNQCGEAMEKLVGDEYSEGLDRNRLILAGAISYALVKMFYPVRVLLSLWGAPYLGRWLLKPISKLRNTGKSKAQKNGSQSTK